MHLSPRQHARTFAGQRKVLVSGASIAGPALAYWLHRYGFAVTVIEDAETIRPGGYPVDLRGSAMQVAERMGLLPELHHAHIRSTRATFLDGDGREIAVVAPEWIHGAVRGRDVELPRGELAAILAALRAGEVPYRFGTSIEAMKDMADGVAVMFADGRRELFDIVVGADGVHSNTRRLAFGPEDDFARPIGFCFAGFSMPNALGLSREAICANVPGRLGTLYAVGDLPKTVFALLAFAQSPALDERERDPVFQRDLTARAFAGLGGRFPGLVDAMMDADDLYFDRVQQIRMPAWSKGRVALVGDAAYAPSFLTGQGSSLALLGAYVLASELASHPDHAEAFAAYERWLRPFVEKNQATVEDGKVGIIPATPEQLERRKAMLRAVAGLSVVQARTERAVHSAFDLVEYDGVEAGRIAAEAGRS